jgi:hypothetical protein
MTHHSFFLVYNVLKESGAFLSEKELQYATMRRFKHVQERYNKTTSNGGINIELLFSENSSQISNEELRKSKSPSFVPNTIKSTNHIEIGFTMGEKAKTNAVDRQTLQALQHIEEHRQKTNKDVLKIIIGGGYTTGCLGGALNTLLDEKFSISSVINNVIEYTENNIKIIRLQDIFPELIHKAPKLDIYIDLETVFTNTPTTQKMFSEKFDKKSQYNTPPQSSTKEGSTVNQTYKEAA